MGGKIRSFYSKCTGIEYFYQDLRPDLCNSGYSDHDISGLDECFPTVIPCDYPDEPGRGIALGDHGLLWNTPWSTDLTEQMLIAGVSLEALPIRFERTAQLVGPGTLLLEYTIANFGQAPFEYLYAAHLMLQSYPITQIVYPPEMSRAYVSVVIDNPVVREQSWVDWPPHESTLLNEPFRAERSTLAKVFSPKLREGITCVSHGDGQEQLTIEFGTDELPYLGVLLAQGFAPLGKDGKSTLLALEPTSSIADDLGQARENGTNRRIPAGEKIRLWIRLSLTERRI
jgi:hypothetical protein